MVPACNKITDAGVCKGHSGSTRILFQEATENQLPACGFDTVVVSLSRGVFESTKCTLPVRKFVFVQMHES